jgi:hypothetical protein
MGLVMTACGGVIETNEADADLDARPTVCEAGAVECAGPLQPCGRRIRTCSVDGTWGEWSCADPSPCP